MVLGKRKADSQLTPESEGKETQQKRFSETVENFPLSTVEEIANRPPLIARRRGSKPAVTPIGNPAFIGSDVEASAEKQTPEPAQPVGEAPGVAVTAEQEKQKVAEEKKSTETSNEASVDATATTESTTEPTKEESVEKSDDKPAGSNWFSGPSPFGSIESNKFTAESNPFAPISSEGSTNNPFATTSNPFTTSGSGFSFGDSSSSLSFTLPSYTPSTLGESAASKEPLVKEQKVTTGEEDEEKIYSDTVRLYQLCVPEAKDGEKEDDVEGKKDQAEKAEKKWIQRGRGELRLNCLKNGRGKARIIVRREKTHQLLINMPLFCNITCKRASDCDLRIVGFNQGPDSSDLVPESYLIRQRNAASSAELEKHLNKFVHPPGSIDPTVETNNSSITNDTTATTETMAASDAPPADAAESVPAKADEEKPAESVATTEAATPSTTEEAPAESVTEKAEETTQ